MRYTHETHEETVGVPGAWEDLPRFTRESGGMIGGDQGDLEYDGIVAVDGEIRITRGRIHTTRAQLSPDEATDLAHEIIGLAYESIGLEVYSH